MDEIKSGIKIFFFVKILIFLIKCYQKTLGLVLPNTCRFTPTCSNYTIEALSRFGIFKGSLMSIYRILRCNPFCSGGYDPVVLPKKGEKYG
ncbi:MAG: membrane protein insertion efficiency factor YidD [candidate division WOR-3 bacterium]